MTVQLKFLGALRHASGKDQVSLECQEGMSVFDLIKNASRRKPALRKYLLDEQLDTPKPNSLVLVNGREISILDGLATKVKDGDEIVFVPVVHGG